MASCDQDVERAESCSSRDGFDHFQPLLPYGCRRQRRHARHLRVYNYINEKAWFGVGGKYLANRIVLSLFCRLLRSSVGVSLLSLANQNILEQESSWVVSLVHQLEAAGMRWVGLSGKPHDIVDVNGVRVGLLAFCGVYGQCKDASGGAPFVPVKYTAKVATAAVTELKEVKCD